MWHPSACYHSWMCATERHTAEQFETSVMLLKQQEGTREQQYLQQRSFASSSPSSSSSSSYVCQAKEN